MVMDNHSSHKSAEVQEALEMVDLERHNLLVATSELNPVEQVWALLKRRWRSFTCQAKGKLKQDEAEAELLKICAGIASDRAMVQRYAEACYSEYLRVLELEDDQELVTLAKKNEA